MLRRQMYSHAGFELFSRHHEIWARSCVGSTHASRTPVIGATLTKFRFHDHAEYVPRHRDITVLGQVKRVGWGSVNPSVQHSHVS